MKNKTPKSNFLTAYGLRLTAGFTLLEAVVYVAILSVLFVIAAHTVILATSVFGASRAKRALAADGFVVMNRILYEIRLAHDVDTEGSVFDSDNGVLKLKTRVGADDAAETTRIFDAASGTVRLAEEGAAPNVLSGKKVSVAGLSFFPIEIAGRVAAVRTALTVENAYKEQNASRTFYGTAVMRGGY